MDRQIFQPQQNNPACARRMRGTRVPHSAPGWVGSSAAKRAETTSSSEAASCQVGSVGEAARTPCTAGPSRGAASWTGNGTHT